MAFKKSHRPGPVIIRQQAAPAVDIIDYVLGRATKWEPLDVIDEILGPPSVRPVSFTRQAPTMPSKVNSEDLVALETLHGLPRLKGTFKQVHWAREVRAGAISDVLKEDVGADLRSLAKMSSADWWIKHVYLTSAAMLEAAQLDLDTAEYF